MSSIPSTNLYTNQRDVPLLSFKESERSTITVLPTVYIRIRSPLSPGPRNQRITSERVRRYIRTWRSITRATWWLTRSAVRTSRHIRHQPFTTTRHVGRSISHWEYQSPIRDRLLTSKQNQLEIQREVMSWYNMPLFLDVGLSSNSRQQERKMTFHCDLL